MPRDPNPELTKFVNCVLCEFRRREIRCRDNMTDEGISASFGYFYAARIIRTKLAAIKKERKGKR